LTTFLSGLAILWAVVQDKAMNADDAPLKQDAGTLMESLLASLLDDFVHWFQRGELMLQDCPTSVVSEDDQLTFRERLSEGLRAVAATRALMKASPQPMAVSMEAMTPWNGLVTEVWGLAAKIERETK
ncbi:MAG: DUF2605 family protein, partial [Cyanobacteriota bacterium]|nr:DUF2605 family protein [Cyanobacteriota bacterium]